MLGLIARRLGLGLLTLWAVSILIFAGTQILPGDVASAILGQSATPEAEGNLREQLGLNRPAYMRYFHWLCRFVRAMSASRSPISGTSRRRSAAAWNTMFLAFWAADRRRAAGDHPRPDRVRYRNGWVDKLISGLALAYDLVAGVLHRLSARLFLRREVDWFPALATVYDGMPFGERMHAVALPAGDADAGGAGAHDAHDARRDPQRAVEPPISRLAN